MKQFELTRTATTFILPVREWLATHNAASSDEVRYYLQGVFMDSEDQDGTLHLVATDENILIDQGVNASEGWWIGEKVKTQDAGFILRADPKDKAFKQPRGCGPLWMHGDTESGILQVFHTAPTESHAERTAVCEFERIDGTFPDWRRVIPSQGESTGEVGLNLDKLEQIRKAVKLYTSHPTLKLTLGPHSLDPITLTMLHNPLWRAVVMPVRV